MVSRAQQNAKLAKVNPEAVSRKLRETREQADANNEEHQAKMRALGVKIEELRAKHDLDPFKNVEEAKLEGQQQTAATLVITPKVITRAPAGRRKAQTQTLNERRSKKEKFRANEMEEQKGKLAMPSKAKNLSGLKPEPTSTVFAESSTASATREAVAANNPDPMDIDHEPSDRLFVHENEKDNQPRYTELPLPRWHISITVKDKGYLDIQKRRPQELGSLEALKDYIRQCEANAGNPVTLAKLYDALRDQIHKAEFLHDVTQYVVRKANILSSTTGLPRIFNKDANFPGDLKADAYQLYIRWYNQNFEYNIMRGIKTVTKDRNADRIDETYRKQFPVDAKYYGEGDLVLGQWWPTQLCTVRDSAHGAAQGGIFGEREKGAYSIVLSGGSGYHDKDDGDVIVYSGTEGKNCTPTENTLHLVKSFELGNPVRVIRSAQQHKSILYRPKVGLRYDGLYVVKGCSITDHEKQIHKFTLVREEGQGPIRYEGKAKRPTEYEEQEFLRLREKFE
jgi:hypothetical protein